MVTVSLKYRNISFILDPQTWHMIGDVLSKRSYMSKSHDDPENKWSCNIIECTNISKHRSFLFAEDIMSMCSYI